MQNHSGKKRAALAAAVLFILFAGSCIWIWLHMNRTQTGGQVCIYLDGTLVETHPLTEDGTYPVYGNNGAYNIVEIRDSGVQISEANCDNQTCVHTGRITSGAYPIVCLPHKLVVQIENDDTGADGVAR